MLGIGQRLCWRWVCALYFKLSVTRKSTLVAVRYRPESMERGLHKLIELYNPYCVMDNISSCIASKPTMPHSKCLYFMIFLIFIKPPPSPPKVLVGAREARAIFAKRFQAEVEVEEELQFFPSRYFRACSWHEYIGPHYSSKIFDKFCRRTSVNHSPSVCGEPVWVCSHRHPRYDSHSKMITSTFLYARF